MNKKGTCLLETKRLILRKFKIEDAFEVVNGYRNQEEFLYYANKEKISLDEEKKILEQVIKSYKQKNYYNFAICLKESDTLIGAINLKVDDSNNSVIFSYAIDNRYTNNGYMSEALERIKNFCFNELDVKYFTGGCIASNIASKRVMEKCNLKNQVKLIDGNHDLIMFCLEKE